MGAFEEKVQGAKQARAVHVYTVPEKIPGEIRSVGLYELTSTEELQAVKRANGESARLAYELAKAALALVNDKVVSVADGSSDEAWAKMHPKLRNMTLGAYAALHSPDEEDNKGFQESHQVRVG